MHAIAGTMEAKHVMPAEHFFEDSNPTSHVFVTNMALASKTLMLNHAQSVAIADIKGVWLLA